MVNDTPDTEDETVVNSSPNRRRILQASAAIAAGSGIVGTATGNHTKEDQAQRCPGSIQCDAFVTFNDQTVGDDCLRLCATADDSVNVAKASMPAECDGGFIDLHDNGRTVGPSGTFKGGYPLGASSFLQGGVVHEDICLELYDGCGKFDSCVTWTRAQWTEIGTIRAMLHLDTDDSGSFNHYCSHEAVNTGIDHAYLCNDTKPPIQDGAKIFPDGPT